MDLFSSAADRNEPLAFRMRPRTLDEYVGQAHIVGPGRLLRRVIQADQLTSVIFYGPPGTGKTTLAWVIANATKSAFITMNAVLSGVKELREAIDKAKDMRDLHGRRTTLFVDEVHRWNKAQQDALLPWVENGTVILVGATTQNPYFEVNPALVSRSRIFQLKSLTEDDLREVVRHALGDRERGYGKYRVGIDDDALRHLVRTANGDARSVLNALELAVETTPSRFPPPEGEPIDITLEIAEESIQRKVVLYDKEGDYHYDTISAFIKSVRGSDPDAVLYWLARMVHAGEDPHFIFRRMLISAGEDVGLADPHAIEVVEASAAAFDRVGLPEGRFHLAHAALYLATCPKSNSSMGFFDALAHIESEEEVGEVPNHLRDPSRDKEGFGHGEGYLYPHAFRDHWVSQQYLPSALQGKLFYQPSSVGYEASIRDQVLRRREIQLAQAVEPESVEILSFSPPDRAKERWLARVQKERSAMLAAVRERVFDQIEVHRHDRVLDIAAGSGLLVWEALRRVPEGGVWAIAAGDESAGLIEHQSSSLDEMLRPVVVTVERPLFADGVRRESFTVPERLQRILDGGVRFDAVVGRNALTRTHYREAAFRLLRTVLAPGGVVSLAEAVPSRSPKLSDFLQGGIGERELVDRFREAEVIAFRGTNGSAGAWDIDDLRSACAASGCSNIVVSEERFSEPRDIGEREIDGWFSPASPYGAAVAAHLRRDEIERILALLRERFLGKPVAWSTTVAFLSARG